MQEPTSRELYMMNGGQKVYIYKDGFGDIYKATAAEEAGWAAEIVANALEKVEKETNRACLQSAIADLVYHQYERLEEVLFRNIHDPNPVRRVVFATALWRRLAYKESFAIILRVLTEKRAESLNDVFLALDEFKDNGDARSFLIHCLEGSDDELAGKAGRTIEMWAWSGMPELRENSLLTDLKAENRYLPAYTSAIEKLKEILK